MSKRFIHYLLIVLILGRALNAGSNLSAPQNELDQDNNHNSTKIAKVQSSRDYILPAVIVGALAAVAITGAVVAIGTSKSNGSTFFDNMESDKRINSNQLGGLPKEQRRITSRQSAVVNKDDFSLTQVHATSTKIIDTHNEGADYPKIDLRVCFNQNDLESAKIDLHPPYTENPHKMLKDEIYRYQKLYNQSHNVSDERIYIVTGTNKKRPGPKYRLQHSVRSWLQEDYFQRRISNYWLSKEGLYTVILRQDIAKSK